MTSMTIVAELVMIVYGLVAVPRLGVFGLAGTVTLCLAARSITMWQRVRQTQGLRTHASWRRMARPLTTLRRLQ